MARGYKLESGETPKEAALKLIKSLSARASFGDIHYELFVLARIDQGLRSAREGRLIPHDVFMRQMNRYLERERSRPRKTCTCPPPHTIWHCLANVENGRILSQAKLNALFRPKGGWKMTRARFRTRGVRPWGAIESKRGVLPDSARRVKLRQRKGEGHGVGLRLKAAE